MSGVIECGDAGEFECELVDGASAGGVGAVKEDLVIDPSGVSDGGVGYVDEPAPGESSFHGGVTDSMAGG